MLQIVCVYIVALICPELISIFFLWVLSAFYGNFFTLHHWLIEVTRLVELFTAVRLNSLENNSSWRSIWPHPEPTDGGKWMVGIEHRKKRMNLFPCLRKIRHVWMTADIEMSIHSQPINLQNRGTFSAATSIKSTLNCYLKVRFLENPILPITLH